MPQSNKRPNNGDVGEQSSDEEGAEGEAEPAATSSNGPAPKKNGSSQPSKKASKKKAAAAVQPSDDDQEDEPPEDADGEAEEEEDELEEKARPKSKKSAEPSLGEHFLALLNASALGTGSSLLAPESEGSSKGLFLNSEPIYRPTGSEYAYTTLPYGFRKIDCCSFPGACAAGLTPQSARQNLLELSSFKPQNLFLAWTTALVFIKAKYDVITNTPKFCKPIIDAFLGHAPAFKATAHTGSIPTELSAAIIEAGAIYFCDRFMLLKLLKVAEGLAYTHQELAAKSVHIPTGLAAAGAGARQPAGTSLATATPDDVSAALSAERPADGPVAAADDATEVTNAVRDHVKVTAVFNHKSINGENVLGLFTVAVMSAFFSNLREWAEKALLEASRRVGPLRVPLQDKILALTRHYVYAHLEQGISCFKLPPIEDIADDKFTVPPLPFVASAGGKAASSSSASSASAASAASSTTPTAPPPARRGVPPQWAVRSTSPAAGQLPERTAHPRAFSAPERPPGDFKHSLVGNLFKWDVRAYHLEPAKKNAFHTYFPSLYDIRRTQPTPAAASKCCQLHGSGHPTADCRELAEMYRTFKDKWDPAAREWYEKLPGCSGITEVSGGSA